MLLVIDTQPFSSVTHIYCHLSSVFVLIQHAKLPFNGFYDGNGYKKSLEHYHFDQRPTKNAMHSIQTIHSFIY